MPSGRWEVAAMEITYDRLNTDDLRGTTQADYLVSMDAHFRLIDGDLTIYDEPDFPVVELARSLRIWLGDPNRGDFVFDSMSFEEVGSVAVRRAPSGWVFSSAFAPGSSTAVGWAEVNRCAREFVSRVERDLLELGIDSDVVIGP
jgi:hypothetical protein